MKDHNSVSHQKSLSQLQETRTSSRHVFDGKLLQVYLDDVVLPDGSSSTREWIRHPGACAIVPVFEDGTIMLLRQYRYPSRKVFIEVPAGKMDAGEPPEKTARRELAEESGLLCNHLEPAGSFYPAIGYADEIIHVYVAWDLTLQKQKTDSDEFLLTYRIPFSKALEMIGDNEIDDGKTICALIRARLWWKKNNPFPVLMD